MQNNFSIFLIFLLIIIFSKTSVALGKKDDQLILNALDALEAKKWLQVKSYIVDVKNPLGRKYLKWLLFVTPNNKVTFHEIKKFLHKNPSWPYQNKLRGRAEGAMDAKISTIETLKWFELNKPKSSVGRTKYALALIASGNKKEGKNIIRKNWVDGNFTKNEEKAFYKSFRTFLTRNDHIERLDRLLWDGKYWSSRRMLYKVPKNWRHLAVARYSLRRRTGNVDTLIKRVPRGLLKHPGLAFERLKWRRRKNLNTASDILRKYPKNSVRPELWWRERAIIARRSLRKGFINDALRFSSQHGLMGGGEFAEAEWISGWIRLRFLKDPKSALQHFETMFSAVKYPISRARGAYWVGRAAEEMGAKSAASKWFQKAASYNTSFYGQLAAERYSAAKMLDFKAIGKPSAQIISDFNNHELVKVVHMLKRLKHNDLILPFINRLYELNNGVTFKNLVAKLAIHSKRPDLAIKVSKRAKREGRELIEVGYPVMELPNVMLNGKTLGLEKALVLSVIRQESAFQQNAVSSANAMGLMQLMPNTAKKMAKATRLPYNKRELIKDPIYNLKLGQVYLDKVLKRYGNSYVLALAAYNAGPKRVRKWIKEFGDPRDRQVDTIDWIEMLPFTETRNYIQRVLENLQVYRYRLTGKETLIRLSFDIHEK